jgi:capsular exopolysaccharide synthesis family protein
MDAIIRTLEAARLERERRIGEDPPESRVEVPTDRPEIGFTDTVVFQLPVIPLDDNHRERERILTPGAKGAEGGPYKMLRTQVMRRLAELNANTLAVLSASTGDGKTLTAINLAIAIAAHTGHTALLVDLDLRNPSVHKRFGFEPTVGIEDCIEQRQPLQEAMVKIAGYERLTVLPARGRVEHSSELIASSRMNELVQELRERYVNRMLIFDLPPVLLTDDALAFSRQVQAGLFVISEGKTARDGVTRSLQLLERLPIVGTVLNRSRQSGGAYY